MVDCRIINDLTQQVGDNLRLYDEKAIKFVGLNRVIRIRRGVALKPSNRPGISNIIMDEYEGLGYETDKSS